MHSCKKVPLTEHFKNKDQAKDLYDKLLKETKEKVGTVKTISLPCCIHWFGNYDFLAILPKKDKLEIRLALDHKIEAKRVFASVPLSKILWKNCIYLQKGSDIDEQLIKWLKESYNHRGSAD